MCKRRTTNRFTCGAGEARKENRDTSRASADVNSSSGDATGASPGTEGARRSKRRRDRGQRKAALPSTNSDATGAVNASEPMGERCLQKKKKRRRRRRSGAASSSKREILETKGNMATSEQAKERPSFTQIDGRSISSHDMQINGHNEYLRESTQNENFAQEIENNNVESKSEEDRFDNKIENKIENKNMNKKNKNRKLDQHGSIQKKNLKLNGAVDNINGLKKKDSHNEKNSEQRIGTKEEIQEELSVSGYVPDEDKGQSFSIQSVCEIFSKELLQGTVDNSINDQKAEKDDNLSNVIIRSEGKLHSVSKRKLLILDLNGLLADISASVPAGRKPDARVNSKAVFKRPFCDDFLKFCFDKFDMAVWSSRRKENVNIVVNFLMPDLKHKLLFSWDQSKCTVTGFKTVENERKPIFFKELSKVWDKSGNDLPWEKGYYNPTNTLLLDDSPYKALRNPPYTAIFPLPYSVENVDDNSLGPGGDLRVYLESLAEVENVQEYIQEHPFGQRPITPSNPSWQFYLQVLGLKGRQ